MATQSFRVDYSLSRFIEVYLQGCTEKPGDMVLKVIAQSIKWADLLSGGVSREWKTLGETVSSARNVLKIAKIPESVYKIVSAAQKRDLTQLFWGITDSIDVVSDIAGELVKHKIAPLSEKFISHLGTLSSGALGILQVKNLDKTVSSLLRGKERDYSRTAFTDEQKNLRYLDVAKNIFLLSMAIIGVLGSLLSLACPPWLMLACSTSALVVGNLHYFYDKIEDPDHKMPGNKRPYYQALA